MVSSDEENKIDPEILRRLHAALTAESDELFQVVTHDTILQAARLAVRALHFVQPLSTS